MFAKTASHVCCSAALPCLYLAMTGSPHNGFKYKLGGEINKSDQENATDAYILFWITVSPLVIWFSKYDPKGFEMNKHIWKCLFMVFCHKFAGVAMSAIFA